MAKVAPEFCRSFPGAHVADCSGCLLKLKWLGMVSMKVTTATRTIEELHTIFAYWGLPEQIIIDNGPRFSNLKVHAF